MGIAMASAKQQRKVGRVMHEFKEGTLDSSSGEKVTSRKQAIAIAMSESDQARNKPSGKTKSGTKAKSGTARRSTASKTVR